MNRMTKKALIKSSADCVAGKMRMDNGFSLVEIMVGMVIGLLGIIIITQIFALAEGQKRTTTSGADAQTNGNIALYSIERDVRQAGYGLSLDALGCSISTSFAGDTANPGALTLVPVTINDGGTNAAGDALPDTLRTLYSTNIVSSLPQKLFNFHPQAAMAANIGSTFNVADLDMVVFFENGKNCTLVQVTGIPSSSTTFNHNSTSPWNPPGAVNSVFPAAGYTTAASTMDLGSMANRNYSIDTVNNNLQFVEVNSNGVTTLLSAAEIVNLQAQYGKDTNSDGIVDTWDTNTPPVGVVTPNPWSQIIAVRIAVLARSGQYEKPDQVLGCTATTVAPSWTGGTMAVPPFPNAGLPSCYRYKVFETVVPLRNVIWGM